MYEKKYNFTLTPFNMTPDSRFFYASQKHEEALYRLLVAINQRNGFAVVTGEIGSGKTTICRTLLHKIEPTTKIALVLNTHLSKKELVTTILDDLGIEYKSNSKTHLMGALNKFLIEMAARDKNVVILIDEAQNLTPSVLEEVRMLSNLETEQEKLLQILLVGQPELRTKLAQPKLEQFSQRIVVYYHLEPLDRAETEAYMHHRMQVAGCENKELFSKDAFDEIYRYSSGTPRLINLAAHNALINGIVHDASVVTGAIVSEAITDLMHGGAYSSVRKAQGRLIEVSNT